MVYDSWLLLVEDTQTLLDWQEKVGDPQTTESMKEVLLAKKEARHCTDRAAGFGLMVQEHTGVGAIHAIADLKSKAFIGKLNQVWLGNPILMNEAGGFFPVHDSWVETDRVVVRSIGVPQYGPADIRLVRFDGGKHWYAKLGSLDVVDEKGRQKWNTQEAAKRAADNYMLALS